MPMSAYSSSNSHGSGNSRHSQKRYVKIANSSEIDESLFGNNGPSKTQDRDHLAEDSMTTALERAALQRRTKKNAVSLQKKNTIQLLTKDLVRNLIIPEEDPTGQSIVVSRRELSRLKHEAQVLTEEERLAALEKWKQDKEELMTNVHDRKVHIKQQDLKRQKNEKLSDLEEEERVKREMLRERALEQLAEQEDEIKRLNELILDAKCHIIRDTQILEKRLIDKELKEDEQRLDEMMEVERVNAIRMQEEIEKRRKEERLIGALRVMEQIEENEKNKLVELEQKDQENRMMKKYLDQLCEEEAEKLVKRKQEQMILRDELNECNADIIRRKELVKEEERLLEEKVIQFQKDKAEREAEYEKEQERISVEREKEVARLRALQERAKDEQAERDALRAKRAQEQNEREWRLKEAEEARKRANLEAMLIESREQQMRQKEHFLAVQAQRERADFERVLRAQKEQILHQKQEAADARKKRLAFSDEIRAQIRDKEQDRLQERSKFFEEGIRLNEEARQRKLKLEEIKRKKLDELRAAGIHEKYLNQIERKINQHQHVLA